MPNKPKWRLRNPVISKVAFVDSGDNPEADIVMFKRRSNPTLNTPNPPPSPTVTLKEGRVLSASNIRRIQSALDELQSMVESATAEKSGNGVHSVSENYKEETMESIAKLKDALSGLGDSENVEKSVEEITKSLEGLQSEFEEAVQSAKDEAASEISEYLESVKAEDEPDEDPSDDISKREDVPEEVRKRYEELEKQAEEANERIAKMERDRKLDDMVSKAKQEFPHVGDAKTLGEALLSVKENTDEDTYSAIEQSLTSANAKIAEGDIYKEYGKSATDSGGDAFDKVLKRAETLRESKPSITKAEAISEVLSADPSLYREYEAEKASA